MVRRNYLVLLFLLCANAGLIAPMNFIARGYAAEPQTFIGTWVANGSKEVLSFGGNRQVALFRLAGHVNLKNEVGKENDYWAECIGLADSEAGSNARCVWRALNKQEIYLTLQGERLTEGSSVTGKIVGGTGAASGITGSIQFKWSSMSAHSANDITAVGGYAKELKGTYQLPE
jgi:hypothetical protein